MDSGTDASIRAPAGNPVIDWIRTMRLDDIPADVVARVQDLLLDTLGVAAGAGITPAAGIAYALAASQFAPGDRAAVRLPFDGRAVSPAGAAYALATRIDNLDAHDGYQPAKGHVGVAVVPALLAFAQALPAATRGRAALAALVAGYEIAARAGATLHASAADYHSSGAWNALGAAVVGARLWELDDPETLGHALGIAEYHAPRAPMMREIDAPSMLHDSSGWGALAGTTAISLARAGFTGSPAELTAIGEEWGDLGARWLVHEQYVKPHPVCFWAQPAVRAALTLRERHGLSPERIRRIRITTFHEATRLARGIPETTQAAQYALAYPVAAALAHGRLGPHEIAGPGLEDPVAHELVERITVTESDEFNARFPAERLATVLVELDDGAAYESAPTQPRGVPADPMDRAAIVDKFRAYATPTLGDETATALEAAVMQLERPDATLDPVLAAVCGTTDR